MIREFYEDKVLFITGISGNVGKVFLEKVLWTLDNISHAYLLIRRRGEASAEQRLWNEILVSECYNRLRQKHADFDDFIRKKLKVIEGDITLDNLGMSAEDREMAISDTNIIFNIAASTKYSESIDVALNNNTLSVLRVLELAQSCLNIQAILHTSTAYAFTHVTGQIEEEVYSTQIDCEELLQQIQSLTKEKAAEETQRIIHPWPNSYTFCKYLAENLVKRRAGNIPFILARLPSVAASWQEPYPGWCDTLTAGQTFHTFIGLGQSQQAFYNGSRGEWVPVDICNNICIASIYFYGREPGVTAINVTNSDRNRITFEYPMQLSVEYWMRYRNSFFQGPYRHEQAQTQGIFNRNIRIKRELPAKIWNFIGQKIKSQWLIEKAKSYEKIKNREKSLNWAFAEIMTIERHFMTKNTQYMIKRMSNQDLKDFCIDIQDVFYIEYGLLYTYGVHRWILKEVNNDFEIDLSGHDLNFKFLQKNLQRSFYQRIKSGRPSLPFSKQDIIDELFQVGNTSSQVTQLFFKNIKEPIGSYELSQQLRQQVLQIASSLIDSSNHFNITAQGLLFEKFFMHCWKRFVIDIHKFTKITKYFNKHKGPIVLVTPYRSKLDFIVLQQIFYKLDLQQPFTTAYEPKENLPILSNLLRKSGTIFIEEKMKNDVLYQAIVEDTIKILLKKKQIVHIYIEDSKNSIGNIQHGDIRLLSYCTSLFYDRQLSNTLFIPIGITYDKVLEDQELQSVMSTPPSAFSNAFGVIGYFGNIHVHVGKTIQLKKFIAVDGVKLVSYFINHRLAQAIISNIYRAQAIAPISIVSSCLLFNRFGMNFSDLTSTSSLLIKYAQDKNYNLGEMKYCNLERCLKHSIQLFPQVINLVDRFEESAEINLQNPNSLKVLSYYSNQIAHMFVGESLISMILNQFAQPMSIGILEQEFEYLFQIFQHVFQVDFRDKKDQIFKNAIKLMIDNGLISQSTERTIMQSYSPLLQIFRQYASQYIEIIIMVLYLGAQEWFNGLKINAAANTILGNMQNLSQVFNKNTIRYVIISLMKFGTFSNEGEIITLDPCDQAHKDQIQLTIGKLKPYSSEKIDEFLIKFPSVSKKSKL